MTSRSINTLTDFLTYQNTNDTRFLIKGDIDLGSLVNPYQFGSNCILYFCGGTLKDGEIIGSNTTIQGASFGVLDNVVLLGTYTNSECDLSWWGCIPYDPTITQNIPDNSQKIKNALASSILRIKVSAKYGISSPVNIGYLGHYIEGSSRVENTRNGFVANSDFPQSSDVTVVGVQYTVRGMFYYYYSEGAVFKNLSIEVNKNADYAFEHIKTNLSNETQAASLYLNDIYITQARVAGILQYACEHLIWDHVYVSNCGIGIYISDKLLNITYNNGVVDSYDVMEESSSPVNMGADNMINLISCRVLFCNYGFVIKGGTNVSLINCESAHNSIFGLFTRNSTYDISNYYSEDDGTCDFWVDTDGEIYGAVNGPGTATWSDLISNNLDGVKTVDYKNRFNQYLYLRAPIYFDRSIVSIHGMFTSIFPRSSEPGSIEQQISDPIQRSHPGVDAVIIAKDGKVNIEGHKVYLLSSNVPELKMPFATYISMSGKDSANPAIFNVQSYQASNRKVTVWYANNTMYGLSYAQIGNYSQMQPSSVAGKLKPNYNVMGGDLYGLPYARYDLRQYASFRELYNGIPLFQLSDKTKLFRYFTSPEVLDKFGDLQQVRARLVIKVIEEATMYIALRAQLQNSSFQPLTFQEGGETCYVAWNSGEASALFKPGYYDFYIKVDLKNTLTWSYLVLSLNHIDVDASKVYFSDILFYDNEDGPNLPAPSYDTYSLQAGYTGQRPYLPKKGQLFYDTLLGKLIVFNGTEWVFPDGSAIPGEA